jgi:hypothetical protein
MHSRGKDGYRRAGVQESNVDLALHFVLLAGPRLERKPQVDHILLFVLLHRIGQNRFARKLDRSANELRDVSESLIAIVESPPVPRCGAEPGI